MVEGAVDPTVATLGATGVAAAAGLEGGESMEKMSPAVALPFRIGNSLCENPMEITRLKLITETAGFLSDPLPDPAGEGCTCSSSGSSHRCDEAEAMAMEEAGDGADLEARMVTGSDDDETIVVESEHSLERSCSLSVMSDCSSVCSVEDLSFFLDPVSEAGTPSSVDDAKTVLSSSSSEVVSLSVLGELNAEEAPVVGGRDSSLDVSPIIVQVKPEIRAGAGSPCSLLVSDHVPLWGHVSIRGRRAEMEDAFVVVTPFSEIPLRMLTGAPVVDGGLNTNSAYLTGHFFGVYDGHGGAQVANYCRERIHMSLIEEIRSLREGLGGRTQEDCQKQWETAFISCFLKVDAEVEGRCNSSDASQQDSSPSSAEPVAPETVGSTAVVAVLCSSHIIVANCGDSRAVLCRGKQPMPLSVDHKPDREDEYARIEAAGGKVIQWNGHRVFGVLAMSRSIGDRYLKPWIIPEPEVTCIPRMKEDECLILASDGLWDVMSNEEACDAARRRILYWHKRNGVASSAGRGEGADPAAHDAADYLSRLALQRGSKDNITVIVIDLKTHRKFKTRTTKNTIGLSAKME
uniref:protein-serine/threonine phosphatase n=1 Tax=Anthurium amnicola TaxID=1678845 RepID=A0A1D1YM09_9ARAE